MRARRHRGIVELVSKPCACSSGRPYLDCCAPFHRGVREAETPALLMRSRFAAFALGDAEYLWRTLDEGHEDRARPKDDVVRDLRAASRAMKYMRLAILDAKGDRVLFHAVVFEKGKDRSFVELSTFRRDHAAWRYVDGIARQAGATVDTSALTIDSFVE
jgi:SEC-C motif-containing protein